jgi:hypothetical protein
MMAGSLTSARAMETRCCSPLERPDSAASRILDAPGMVVEEGQLHVVERGCARQEIVPLEHETDPLVPYLRVLVTRELAYIGSVEEVVAGRRDVQTAHEVHQCRLAGAGRAHDSGELPALDRQVYAAEGVDYHLTHLVVLRNASGLNDGSHMS